MSEGPSGSREQPIHSAIRITMRTYGKCKDFMYKKTVSYQQRQARLATEWDIRLDISDELPLDHILGRVRENLEDYSYVLVSGIEHPDQPVEYAMRRTQMGNKEYEFKGHAKPRMSVNGVGTGSNENHVHICVVLFVPLQRADVLKMLRGPRKLGDEYASPRNAKFTYAGWIIHHGKPGFKIEGEPLIRFEHGTLPMDPFTTDSAMKIQGLLKKWGTDGMKQRFAGYTDLLNRESIKAKIEQLQMQLEDKSA